MGSYSADVSIALYAEDRVYSPRQTTSDCVFFRKPQAIKPSHARLVISIDGTPYESILEILPHESPSARIPVRIVRRANMSARA